MSLADGTCGTGGWTGPLPGDPDNNSILTAVAVYGGIEVSWTYPTLNPEAVSYVQIYRGVTNVLNNAVLYRIVSGNSFFDAIPDTDPLTYYYWIRIMSVYGTEGDPIGPAIATTVPIATQMLTLLEGQLTESAFIGALKAKITNIATLEGSLAVEVQDRLFGDASLGATIASLQTETGTLTTAVLNETTARITADNAQVTSINALGATVNSPTTGLTTKASVAYVDQAEADAVSSAATASRLLMASLGGQNLYGGLEPESVGPGIQRKTLYTLKSVADGNTHLLVPGEKLTISGVVWQDATSALDLDQYAGLEIYTRNSIGTWIGYAVAGGPAGSTSEAFVQTTITLPATEADMVDVILALGHRPGDGTYDGTVYAKRIQIERGEIATAYKGPSVVDLTDVYAAISTEETARVTADSALASTTATLQTQVNGNTSSISTQATSINGLNAQYTVKVDVNGYVSGYGLATTAVNGIPTSEFAVVADKFSIAPVATDPGAADGSPFFHLTTSQVIGGVTVPAGTYMKSAYIHDASITNAKIGNIIQSADYVAGSAGWKIDKAGQMEMNNATFRGTLSVKSATTGARLEITGDVIKVYDSGNNLRVRIGNLSA